MATWNSRAPIRRARQNTYTFGTPPDFIGVFRQGVNLAGAEFGVYPNTGEIDYLATKKITFIRLPMDWVRLQPVLYAPLNAAYLAAIKGLVDYAAAHGATVLLDLHNYGGYGANKLGDGVLANSALADVWTRLATVFAGNLGVHGYDIMNEPSNMPNAAAWPAAAQATVDAIRLVDRNTKIYVEGDGYASAGQWTNPWTGSSGGGNTNLHITDPSNKIVYSAHCYADHDNSGRFSDYDVEAASNGADVVAPGTRPSVVADRISVFYNWGKARGYSMHIGECGVANTDARWLTCLDQGIAYCQSKGIEITCWAGGPAWGAYLYSLEPRTTGYDAGGDARQMAVLTKYTSATQPNLYFMDVPLRGTAGVAVTVRLEYRGTLSAPVTVTLNDGGAGGTFSSTTAVIPTGYNGTVSVTYTAATARRVYFGCSNNGGLVDPTGLLVTIQDLLVSETATAENIFSLRRIYAPYIGPAITLRRTSDDAQSKFYFLENDEIDIASITSFAGGSSLRVVTWYDQGPKAQHANGIDSVNDANNQWGVGQTFAPASPNDQPLFILNGQNGHPVIRRSGHRQSATSLLDSVLGHTVMATFKPTSVAAAAWFAAWDVAADFSVPGNALGQWNMSDEAVTKMSMGIDNDTHHTYVTRWRPNIANGRQTFRDGTQIAAATTTHTSLSGYQYCRTMNLGWFKYGAQVATSCDECERLVFSGAVSDATIAAYQASALAYWSTYAPPVPIVPGPDAKMTLLGVNWSGLEFNGGGIEPPNSSMDYWLDKNIQCARIPFLWQYVQPTDRGALDATFLAKIQRVVARATNRGCKAIIDLHNFGGDPFSGSALATDATGLARFTDIWSRLATVFAGNSNVIFGLMNEPGQTWPNWYPLVNAGIAAIRAAGATQLILVPSGQGGGASTLLSFESFKPGDVVDSGNNYALEVHQYFDAGSSGTSSSVTSASAAIEIIKQMTALGDYLNVPLFLGEFGAGPNALARDCLEALLRHMQQRADRWLGGTQFGAGAFWPQNYVLLCEPYVASPGLDQIQATPLFQYLNGGAKYGYQQPVYSPMFNLVDSTTPAVPTYSATGTAFGQGLSNGYLRNGAKMYPTGYPFTVDCRMTGISGSPAVTKYLHGANGVCYAAINASGNVIGLAGNVALTSTTNVCDGQPHHIELCMDATVARLFVDGNPVSTVTVSRAVGGGWAGDIGTKTNSETIVLSPGIVYEVATWGSVRHTSAFTPPSVPYTGYEHGLIALWHLNGSSVGVG